MDENTINDYLGFILHSILLTVLLLIIRVIINYDAVEEAMKVSILSLTYNHKKFLRKPSTECYFKTLISTMKIDTTRNVYGLLQKEQGIIYLRRRGLLDERRIITKEIRYHG